MLLTSFQKRQMLLAIAVYALAYIIPGAMTEYGYSMIIFGKDLVPLVSEDVLKVLAGGIAVRAIFLDGWRAPSRQERADNRRVNKKVKKKMKQTATRKA